MKFVVTIAFFLASACAYPSSPDGRVAGFGGASAVPKRVPYLVGLHIYSPIGYGWCTGSMISENFVLTAAQCVYEAQAVDLYFGAYNITKRSEEGRVMTITLGRNIKLHDNYNKSTGENDIALVKLLKTIEYTDFIKSVPLPEPNFQELGMGVASGWGYPWRMGWADLVFHLPKNKLKNVETELLENASCNPKSDKNMCVFFPFGESTCRGDTGGPLVVYRDNKPILVGIILHEENVECASTERPTAYLRVSPYLQWIQDNISHEDEIAL